MARFAFCGPAYKLQSPIQDGEQLINGYLEASERSGALSAMTILHTPGLALRYTLPEEAISEIFEVNGRGFTAESNFYELFADLTFKQIGTLNGPPLSPTQIRSCQTHLLILSNGDVFVYVLTAFTDSNNVLHNAGDFIAVDMAQFNGPVAQIDFIDGYFVATIQNSNTFQVSNLEDGTTWNGLFISTISQTQQQAMMSTFFFFFPAMLLSGFSFPIANMPPVIQWLTYLNPVAYFLVVVRTIFLKGVGLSYLWPHLLALAAMGLVTLVLAVRRFHKTL